MVPTSDREYIIHVSHLGYSSGIWPTIQWHLHKRCGNVQRHGLQAAVRLDVSSKRLRLRRGEVSSPTGGPYRPDQLRGHADEIMNPELKSKQPQFYSNAHRLKLE